MTDVMLATLKYLADDELYREEKPYTLFGFPDHVQPTTNCRFDIRDGIRLINSRDCETQPELQDSGFEFLRLPSGCDLRCKHFEAPAGREQVWKYLIETIDGMKQHLGAAKVLCFDWRFRRTGSSCGVNEQLGDLENARYRALAPAALMHCDYSYQGGLETLETHLTADELASIAEKRCRARIVNVWRPLHTVEHSPLVICDPRSVSREDVLEVDQVAPTKVELSMSLQYREGQRYYWLPDQSPDEVVVFTSWDSVQKETTSSHTPHGAWMNSENEKAKPRESVEVRLIVLWND